MGKMKELSTVLDEIVTCGETLVQGAERLRDMMEIIDGLAECGKNLIASGKALKEYFSDTGDAPVPDEPKKKAPARRSRSPSPMICLTRSSARKTSGRF